MLGFLWILQTKMLFHFILQEEKKKLTVLSHRYTGNCDLKVQKKNLFVCIMMCHPVFIQYISEWYLNIDTDSHTHTHTEMLYTQCRTNIQWLKSETLSWKRLHFQEINKQSNNTAQQINFWHIKGEYTHVLWSAAINNLISKHSCHFTKTKLNKLSLRPGFYSFPDLCKLFVFALACH